MASGQCPESRSTLLKYKSEIRTPNPKFTMSLLVVGSVAFDAVETPFGKCEKMLGGSGSHFSISASFFTDVRIVALLVEILVPQSKKFLTPTTSTPPTSNAFLTARRFAGSDVMTTTLTSPTRSIRI